MQKKVMTQLHDLESTAMASTLGLREKHGLNGYVKVIQVSLDDVQIIPNKAQKSSLQRETNCERSFWENCGAASNICYQTSGERSNSNRRKITRKKFRAFFLCQPFALTKTSRSKVQLLNIFLVIISYRRVW